MSIDIKQIEERIKDIRDYADDLEDIVEELWDAYLEVSEERDELEGELINMERTNE